MSAKIQLTMEDAQVHAQLEKERKNFKKVESAVKSLGGAVEKEHRGRIRSAEAIIKKQRSEIEIIDDKIKSLRQYGNTSEEAGRKADAAIQKLLTSHKSEQAAIGETITKNDKASVVKLKSLDSEITRYTKLRAGIEDAYGSGKISADQYSKKIKLLNDDSSGFKGLIDKTENFEIKSGTAFSTGKITKFAKSFAGVAGAIGVVREALQFFSAEKDKALSVTDDLDSIRRDLRTVVGKPFDKLETRANELSANPKLGLDAVAARELVFAAESSGFVGKEARVAQAGRIVGNEEAISLSGDFRKVFAKEKLTIDKAINTSLVAASQTSQKSSALIPQIRKAAEGNVAGNFQSSDIAAAASILNVDFSQSTGDRLKGLGTKLSANAATKDLNFLDAVKKLDADPELKKQIVGGSAELQSVVAKLTDRFETIKKLDRRIETEQAKPADSGLLQSKINEALDPDTQSGRIELARRAKIAAASRRDLELETNFSASSNSLRADAADRQSRLLRKGSSFDTRFLVSKADSLSEFTGVDRSTASGFSKATEIASNASLAKVIVNQFKLLGTIFESISAEDDAAQRSAKSLSKIEAQGRDRANVIGVGQ